MGVKSVNELVSEDEGGVLMRESREVKEHVGHDTTSQSRSN